MLTKTTLKEQIENFPDNFSIDELVERLILMEKIECGNKQSENGEVITDEELDKEIIHFREKRAKDLSEIIIEAFEKISDQRLIKKHMNYINVFFGDEKLLHRKMIKEWQ